MSNKGISYHYQPLQLRPTIHYLLSHLLYNLYISSGIHTAYRHVSRQMIIDSLLRRYSANIIAAIKATAATFYQTI